MVGRIIFADFLELPLEKYKRFIEKVEASLFDIRGLTRIKKHGLAQITCAHPHEKYSPNVIAKIVKTGKGFAIRYVYEGFNKIYEVKNVSSVQIRPSTGSGRTLSRVECVRNKSVPISVIYKLRRISSRNLLTHKILNGIIEHQREYLKTGSPIDLVPLSQVKLTECIDKSTSNETQYAPRNTQYDNSWASRLVSRLSVITPSGEEKPLKWFFQTQKDVNKRLIKQLLDKESEDLQSGKLKRPYTDNELKTLLEALLRKRNTHYARRTTNFSLSRHSIGHCRKDMGIPPAKRRLSGYKYPPLSANFSMPYPFTIEAVTKYAPEASGIYELSIKDNIRNTHHAIRNTNVIYIGSTKSLRKRLREHLGKNSKNGRIRDFLKKYECSFRYIQFSTPHFHKEEEGRLYSLFVSTYGTSPKCNRVKP